MVIRRFGALCVLRAAQATFMVVCGSSGPGPLRSLVRPYPSPRTLDWELRSPGGFYDRRGFPRTGSFDAPRAAFMLA
jgi:hypothetical protein